MGGVNRDEEEDDGMGDIGMQQRGDRSCGDVEMDDEDSEFDCRSGRHSVRCTMCPLFARTNGMH